MLYRILFYNEYFQKTVIFSTRRNKEVQKVIEEELKTGYKYYKILNNINKSKKSSIKIKGIDNIIIRNIEKSEIFKIYNRNYQKMYCRMRRGKILKEEFEIWQDKSRNIKAMALKGDITTDEYKKLMQTMSNEF